MPLPEAAAIAEETQSLEQMEGAVQTEPIPVGPDDAGYEYTRQDGTVERAANRDEAIKLCPVLGKLAMSDPESANMLLELASMGQAKMAEEAEQAKPEPIKQEAAVKADVETKPNKSVSPSVNYEENTANHKNKETLETMSKHFLEAVQNFASQEKRDERQRQATSPAEESRAIVSEQSARKEDKNKPVHTIKTEKVKKEHVREKPKDNSKKKSASNIMPKIKMPSKEKVSKASKKEAVTNDSTVTMQKPVLPKNKREVKRPEVVKSSELEVSEPKLPDTYIVENIFAEESENNPPENKASENARIEAAEVIAEGHAPVDRIDDQFVVEPMAENDFYAPELSTDIVDNVMHAEDVPLRENTEPELLQEILAEEPVGIVEKFSEALMLAVNANEATAYIDEPVKDNKGEESGLSEVRKEGHVPAIAIAVVEKLAELEEEEKQDSALILKKIDSLINQLKIAQEKESGLPNVEEIKIELLLQIEELFLMLGMDCYEEDLEAFLNLLLRLEFAVIDETESQIELDLEKEGTHEAKRQSPSLASAIVSDVEHSLERMLGCMVLFRASIGQPT